MSKLSTKESGRYHEAEQHLYAAFGSGNVRCLWEAVKPKFAANFAMIAGFMIAFGDKPRFVILQVYEGGAGWEVFGCPSALKIEPTFDALKAMWKE